MTLNMAPHSITKNLECALWHLWHKKCARVLRVDVICINQTDDDERSKQVAIIRKIYNRATKVYAWLGEATGKSNCVIDVLQEFQMRKRQVIIPTHFDTAKQLHFHRQLF